MGRGGKRNGAGRKAKWIHVETEAIRVPKIFIPQLLEIARKLDRGEAVAGISNPVSADGQLLLLGLSTAIVSADQYRHGLGVNALARRLRVSSGTVHYWKDQDTLPDWSESKDPAQIRWRYDAEAKRFFPIEPF